jgi:chemotaxis protein CheD
VAVCLYDTKLKSGAINHYMLSLWNGEGLASPKYGNVAIDKLYTLMRQQGSNPNNLIAKVFGGAKQIHSTFDVGGANIRMAEDTLKTLNIKIVAQSTGGNSGRKIIFETHSGLVQMKFLSNLHT